LQHDKSAFILINCVLVQVKKAMTDQRMKRYKIICYCGATLMVGTDKAALLNRVYQYNHTAAQICTIYLTVALVSMLLGIISSSFPDSAPCAMPIAWNGTLQVFLYLNAYFHLSIMEVYPELLHLTISFMVTSVLFSIYWSFCTRSHSVFGGRRTS